MSVRFVARWLRLRHYKERHESALSGGGTSRAWSVVWVGGLSAAASEGTRFLLLRRRTEGRPRQRELERGRARGAFPGGWGTSGPRGVIGGEEPP